MKIKKTPEEIVIKIPGNINDNDFFELVSFIRDKISGPDNKSGQISGSKKLYKEQNWWKENQLLI